jgi:tripartite-type tricarboxylate transporter receptor subunit TctC
MRRHWNHIAALAALFIAAPAVAQQDYPTREIRAICAYAAGSGADVLVRYYSDQLSRLAGKRFLVENRVGAQGIVGTEYAARAEPNGYTILFVPASANLAAAPHLFKKLGYDPIKDFATVAPISWLPFTFAVDAKSQTNSLKDLVAELKRKGTKGSYGIGNNTGQVSAALLKEMAGLQSVQISYKTLAQAIPDLSAGQLDFIVWDATGMSGQAKGGRVKILAVTSARRSSSLPDVPTMAELGYNGFDLSAWWGVVVPAGTPKPIIDKLAGWIAQINASEETRKFLANVATDVLNGSPEWMANQIKVDTERWARFVKLANIEPE